MAQVQTIDTSRRFTQVYFIDANTQFSIDGNDVLIENLDAVKNQIFNVLTTTPGERPFEPEFGSDVPGLLFEPNDDRTAWRIETAIFRALDRWMGSRIQLIQNLTRVEARPEIFAFDVTIVYALIRSSASDVFRVRFNR